MLSVNGQSQVESEVIVKLHSIRYPFTPSFEVSSCTDKLSGKGSVEIVWHQPNNIIDDGKLSFADMGAVYFAIAYRDGLSKYPDYDHVIVTIQKTSEPKVVRIHFYIIGNDVLCVDEKGKVKPVEFKKN